MALSNSDRDDTARQLIRKIFVEANSTANLSVADVRAAIDSIDDSFDALASGLTQNQSVAGNINARFPEPFKSTAGAQMKGVAVAFVAMKRGGVI